MTRVPAARTLVGRAVSVDVPATTANLGAGFDALALALDLSNIVHVEAVPATLDPPVEVTIHGEGSGLLPGDDRNHFVAMLRAGLAEGGLREPGCGWRVRMENDIPVARGLGSSAAATVGAFLAADALLGGDVITPERILELAAAADGHADNAAAALLGGLCVVVTVDGRPRALRVEPPTALLAVLFVPERPLPTSQMRATLPDRVPFEDAVHNVAAAALAVAALCQARLDLLGPATMDRLHEPYRAAAYPELPQLISAAREAGALGACLSGAGSTVVAFSDTPAAATRVATALAARAQGLGLPGRTALQRARPEGARILGRSFGRFS